MKSPFKNPDSPDIQLELATRETGESRKDSPGSISLSSQSDHSRNEYIESTKSQKNKIPENVKDPSKPSAGEKVLTHWTVETNSIKLIETKKIAVEYASLMQFVPYDANRLVQFDKGLKESLILIVCQSILSHLLLQFKTETSAQCRISYAMWASNYIYALIAVLEITESPAVTSILESLTAWGHDGSLQFIQKLSNPASFFSSFEQQCISNVGAEYEKEIEKVRLYHLMTAPKDRADTTQSSPSSPANADQGYKRNYTHLNPETISMKTSQSQYDFQIMIKKADNRLETINHNKFVHPTAAAIIVRDFFMACICTCPFDACAMRIFDLVAKGLAIPELALRIAVENLLYYDLAGSMRHNCSETMRDRYKRRFRIAGVAVGLGALTALTAGMAAPAIAAGIGALGIAGTSGAVTFLSSLGGSAAVASLFGAGSAGLSGWKYSIRIGKIGVFKFEKLEQRAQSYKRGHNSDSDTSESNVKKSINREKQRRNKQTELRESRKKSDQCSVSLISDDMEENETLSIYSDTCIDLASSVMKPSRPSFMYITPTSRTIPLSVTVCISGWLRSMEHTWLPWECLLSSLNDIYTLVWDPQVLLNLGNLVVRMLSKSLAVNAAQLWLQTTVAGALSTALAWPVAVINYASTLDNAWMACKERADQGGKLLADALSNRKIIGSRPITLIGFSMGASVIFNCLLALRKKKKFYLIEDVILMGTPETTDKSYWCAAREVVSGRFINIHSSSDWLLGLLYRYMEWGVTVAGLSAVKVEGIENYDLKDVVKNHSQYADNIMQILAMVNYLPVSSNYNYRYYPQYKQETTEPATLT